MKRNLKLAVAILFIATVALTGFGCGGDESISKINSSKSDLSGVSNNPTDLKAGATWYVSAGATGTGDCMSWANACTTVQAAVVKAVATDMIWVAAGTYSTGTATPVLVMKAGVSIYGSFEGIETDLSQRQIPPVDASILDGMNVSKNVVKGASNARLDGFIIQNGNGGTTTKGGGLYADNNTGLVVENCDFTTNFGLYGGGVYSLKSQIQYINCNFDGNTTSNNGGGVYAYLGTHSFTNCTFTTNSSTRLGGGAYSWTMSSVQYTKCIFDGNQGYNGAGIYTYNGPQSINKCIFRNNVSSRSGAAIYNNIAITSLVNSLFHDNIATSDGGTIQNYNQSNTDITNCTFTQNNARIGGAVSNWTTSSSTITNCIIYDNGAVKGSSIYNFKSGGGTATVNYSNIQGGYPGTGNLNLNPVFSDPANDNFHLDLASPCLDVGNPAVAPSDDLDNFARPSPADAVSVDMGAYEFKSNRVYVDLNAMGLGDGTNWANAFNTIQEGIDAALDGSMVWIAQGTYTATGTAAVAKLKDRMTLYGGFDGTEISLVDRDPVANPTILDGQNTSAHIVVGSSNSRVDGITIRNGNAANNRGGGIFMIGEGNFYLSNCVLENNFGILGAALFAKASILTIENTTFQFNSASKHGAGIYNYFSAMSVTNCTFTQNDAINYGGGIYNYDGAGTNIDNCVFEWNSGTRGGGVYNYIANFAITDSYFANNIADIAGAGVYNNKSPIAINNCLFAANSAALNGGGILNNDSDPIITNCTFNGNTAYRGGAISNWWGAVATIRDCILWGDTAPLDNEIYLNSSTAIVSYCNVQGGYAGTGNINADPLFVSGYYLSQTASGQGVNSPSLNTGSDLSSNLGMDFATTRTDGVEDTAQVDMGYHYPLP